MNYDRLSGKNARDVTSAPMLHEDHISSEQEEHELSTEISTSGDKAWKMPTARRPPGVAPSLLLFPGRAAALPVGVPAPVFKEQ